MLNPPDLAVDTCLHQVICGLFTLSAVRIELALLKETWSQAVQEDDVVRRQHDALKEINEKLWEIEDDVRDKERVKEIDERFVELARSVYFTNDRRSQAMLNRVRRRDLPSLSVSVLSGSESGQGVALLHVRA
jgi:hypothetical protein